MTKPRADLDRRNIVERRVTGGGRAQRTNEDVGTIVLEILPPEERAAQVERIYNEVPAELREEIGLTYAHVRAVLEALR